jgi:hypothetical protein
MPSGRRCLLAVAALALLGPSCGKGGRKPVFPVEGRVLVGKQPAAGALVIFHPVEDDGDPNKPRARAGEDGTFSLTTYAEGDGAPAGEYVVTVEWPAPRKTPFEPEGRDRLAGRFRDPRVSKIRFAVEQGPNRLPPIELP